MSEMKNCITCTDRDKKFDYRCDHCYDSSEWLEDPYIIIKRLEMRIKELETEIEEINNVKMG